MGRDRGCCVLRKSEIASADASRVCDPTWFETPWEFDPYWVFEARKKPSGESISQLVSATADHLHFGYGKYACPGRFFVAHEVKPVALCYLLLKHDWKTSENATVPFTIDAGLDTLVNPEVKVKYRRRKEEIGLDLPVFGAAEWIEERCSQLGEKWKSPLQRWLVCDQPCCWDLIYIPMMGNLPSQVSNLNLSAYMPVNSWSLTGPP